MCKENEMDKEIEEIFKNLKDFSDEDLLREFENASKQNIPYSISAPSEEEFERVWERIQAEKNNFEQKADRPKKRREPLKAVIQWLKHFF